jgi:UDP-N-acetylglucosamine--N-acetylmuramyl-(pentapeptide) pyrophosphoryl-undecaprenol N-acetylglucosamine transferase
MGLRVVVMAGGTGGHIFPAIAVADELAAQGVDVTWFGTQHSMESRLVPEAGYPIVYLNISGLRGKGLKGWMLAPFKITLAISQAIRLLRKIRPAVVLGMGGFASGPGGIAAKLLGIPLIIHEQNAIAGMTNRWLAKVARTIFFAFPGAFPGTEGNQNFKFCGNPVRKNIIDSALPADRFAQRQGRLQLLVLGGSLGAAVLNEVVPAAIKLMPEGDRPVIRHQTGERTLELANESYQKNNIEAEIRPFINDMAEAYCWADLVICRAGALTIAELAATGVGAILVPFPQAVDNHQMYNAKYLTDKGAGYLMLQKDISAEVLSKILIGVSREKALVLADKSRQLAVIDAASQIANYCLKVAAK